MRTSLLLIHIAAGTAGLMLGPLALAARHRPSGPSMLVAYQAGVAMLCSSAMGLVILKPELWGLGLIAVGTQAAAARAGLVRRQRRPGWTWRQVPPLGGSYISLVTAFLVVNVGGPMAWVLPSLVGSPLIARAARRARQRATSPDASFSPVAGARGRP